MFYTRIFNPCNKTNWKVWQVKHPRAQCISPQGQLTDDELKETDSFSSCTFSKPQKYGSFRKQSLSPPCGANCQCHWLMVSSINATSVILKRKFNWVSEIIDGYTWHLCWHGVDDWSRTSLLTQSVRHSEGRVIKFDDHRQEWLPAVQPWNDSK